MYEAFFQMKHTPFSRGIPVEEMYTDPDISGISERDGIPDNLPDGFKADTAALLQWNAGTAGL